VTGWAIQCGSGPVEGLDIQPLLSPRIVYYARYAACMTCFDPLIHAQDQAGIKNKTVNLSLSQRCERQFKVNVVVDREGVVTEDDDS
jgi:hypothetical protein